MTAPDPVRAALEAACQTDPLYGATAGGDADIRRDRAEAVTAFLRAMGGVVDGKGWVAGPNLAAAVEAVAKEPPLTADHGWQPIESAPTGDAGTRDAPAVLVYAAPAHGLPGVMAVARWHIDAGWCVDELRHVTHWMPLPPPPEAPHD